MINPVRLLVNRKNLVTEELKCLLKWLSCLIFHELTLAFISRIDTSFHFTDDSIQVIQDQCEMLDDVIPNTLSFGVSSEINHKKLQTIEHLVQKLTRLNSTHDEAHTDYIASLSENTKPDD
ncbi:protein longifolia 1, partial [Tanacetum coccineum]